MSAPPVHHRLFRGALVACLVLVMVLVVRGLVADWSQVRTWPAHLEHAVVSILEGAS